MNEPKYLAYLLVKDFQGNVIDRIGLSNISEHHVERVMSGMLINMNPDYYIDDSEVDAARKEINKGD